MANILQSLGDAIERQQQRKHENNMEVLRAIYTRPGMIVLGVILLGAALALIWPQIAPETDNTNSIVIDMSDFDFGDEEMNRTVRKWWKTIGSRRNRADAPVQFSSASVRRSALSARRCRGERRSGQKQFLTILRLKRQKRSPFRQSLWKTPRRRVRRPTAGRTGLKISSGSTRRAF